MDIQKSTNISVEKHLFERQGYVKSLTEFQYYYRSFLPCSKLKEFNQIELRGMTRLKLKKLYTYIYKNSNLLMPLIFCKQLDGAVASIDRAISYHSFVVTLASSKVETTKTIRETEEEVIEETHKTTTKTLSLHAVESIEIGSKSIRSPSVLQMQDKVRIISPFDETNLDLMYHLKLKRSLKNRRSDSNKYKEALKQKDKKLTVEATKEYNLALRSKASNVYKKLLPVLGSAAPYVTISKVDHKMLENKTKKARAAAIIEKAKSRSNVEILRMYQNKDYNTTDEEHRLFMRSKAANNKMKKYYDKIRNKEMSDPEEEMRKRQEAEMERLEKARLKELERCMYYDFDKEHCEGD